MIFSSSFDDSLKSRVKAFLDLDQPERLSLTLDGFGVNSALQYSILSMIGLERLKRFKQINVISGSTYVWFCFWAYRTGQLRLTSEELKRWDKKLLKISGIRPVLTASSVVSARLFARPSLLIPSRSLSDVLEYAVAPEIYSAKISDFPTNLQFWLYDRTSRSLKIASPGGTWNEMSISDLIQAAPNVPGVYREFGYGEHKLSDPVYSEKRSEMYMKLRSTSGPHLFSNPVKDRVEGLTHYIKPHPIADGRKMIRSDLLKFIVGRGNGSINAAIDYGLIGPRIKEL